MDRLEMYEYAAEAVTNMCTSCPDHNGCIETCNKLWYAFNERIKELEKHEKEREEEQNKTENTMERSRL